jgi:HAD superfamily hydrolase (TIGR01484 family)
MTNRRDGNDVRPRFLATDLDGTLIPLAGVSDHHTSLVLLADLLKHNQMSLAYVTGRHFASVRNAISEFDLPLPDWILCDVGTSAFERRADGEFYLVDQYAQTLSAIVLNFVQKDLLNLVTSVPHLRLQESEKQGQFKTSFYAPEERLEETVAEINQRLSGANAPYQIISSIDPFTGDGLIDLLPVGVSKAFALEWLCHEHNASPRSVIFSGDSGNDMAAFNAGYNTIIVGNAEASIVDQVQETHRCAGWPDRLYRASQYATSGVLEGVQHFLGAK